MAVFSPARNPRVGSSGQVTLSVATAYFADDYAQDTGLGLSSGRENLTLSFDRLPPSEWEYIRDFIKDNKGLVFDYTLPGESSARHWVCKEYTRAFDQYEYVNISMRIEERFIP